jgi:hypothetical protein
VRPVQDRKVGKREPGNFWRNGRYVRLSRSDGRVGAVKDFLFDDQSWKIRWMVVDTGQWMPGRQVLIHPSAIAPLDVAGSARRGLPMTSWGDTLVVSVRLTKQQIEGSPEASEDEPVTKQMEAQLYDYYGCDPHWGPTYFGPNVIATPFSGPPLVAVDMELQAAEREIRPGDGDRHLRSVATVNGYHVHATDGDLGHVENFPADDVNWDIRYLVIATHNWWPGKDVQLAPHAVRRRSDVRHRCQSNVRGGSGRSGPASKTHGPVARDRLRDAPKRRRRGRCPSHSIAMRRFSATM